MAIFKRLKKDIGIEDEPKIKKKAQKTKPKKKEPSPPTKAVEEEAEAEEEAEKEAPGSPSSAKKVPQKEESVSDYEEKMKKISTSTKGDSDWLKAKGQLAVDVYQTDTEFCVQAPIAGVNQDNLDIAIENEMLVIKGEREEPNQDKERKYFYQECYWGPFSRQIILPEDVDPEKIKASLKKGILLITIPKTKAIKKKVTIEVG